MNGSREGPKRVPRPEEEWIKIPCPVIIDEKTWAAARRRAKRNQKRARLIPGRQDKVSVYLLSGLMRCQCCGNKMHGTSNTKARMRGKVVTRYLACTNQNRFPDKYNCRQPRRIRAEPVEEAVLDTLVEAFRDPSHVMTLIDAHTEQLQKSMAAQDGMIGGLQAKLTEAQARRNRAVALHIDGLLDAAALRTQVDRIDKEVAVWQEELGRLEEASRQRKATEEIEQVAWAIAGDIREDMAEATVEEKKALIRALVEQVWIDGENNISVECVLPDLTAKSADLTANQTALGTTAPPWPTQQRRWRSA
jgi:site-specific DNA recombinase